MAKPCDTLHPLHRTLALHPFSSIFSAESRPADANTMARPTLLALPVLLACLTYVAAYFSPLGQWAQTALVLNNTIYVYGGAHVGDIGLSNLYTLDVSISWSTTDPAWADHNGDAGTFTLPQTAFGTMFPAYDNQSFYVWGGGNSVGVKLVDGGFAQYTIATKQWSLPSATANIPMQRRELNAATSSSGVAYIWGGYGDPNTEYEVPSNTTLTPVKIFNDMITFDTVKLVWNIINVSGAIPIPRIEYTSTMLPNNQMLILGGLTGQQVNNTFVTLLFAAMSDVPIFDTNTATWTSNTASGNVPSTRRMHTAILADDGISILIFGGGTSSESVNMNDVAVLNTQTMLWSQASVSGNPPQGRFAPGSVLVNGQMIIFFGYSNAGTGLNDVAVLDLRQTPYAWTTSFAATTTTTNSTTTSSSSISTSTSTSSSGLSAVGGVGGIVGLVLGVLLIVAIILLLFCWKPWRRRNHSQVPQGPGQPYRGQPPPPPAQQYNPSMGQTQPSLGQTQPYNTYANVGANQQPAANYAYPTQPIYTNPGPQYGVPGGPQYGVPGGPQYGAPGGIVYSQPDQSQQSGKHIQLGTGPQSPTGLPAYPQTYKPNFVEGTPTYTLQEMKPHEA